MHRVGCVRAGHNEAIFAPNLQYSENYKCAISRTSAPTFQTFKHASGYIERVHVRKFGNLTCHDDFFTFFGCEK